MMIELWEAVAPSVLTAIASVLGLLLTGATWRIERWTGLRIEAQHREALHSALVSGVAAALEGNLTGRDAVRMAVDYARQSVPDAIDYLIGRQDQSGILTRLAEAKLRELMARSG